jgi:hypothetical protein
MTIPLFESCLGTSYAEYDKCTGSFNPVSSVSIGHEKCVSDWLVQCALFIFCSCSAWTIECMEVALCDHLLGQGAVGLSTSLDHLVAGYRLGVLNVLAARYGLSGKLLLQYPIKDLIKSHLCSANLVTLL